MKYDYKAKVANVRNMVNYWLTKTISMFEYAGLPETIPARELEKLIQTHGYAFLAEVDGKVYALWGALGGEPDVYGNPTTITVSNTALKLSKTFDLEADGVLIRNDALCMGLLPMFEKTSVFLMENEISMMVWGFNSRNQKMISAPDDKTKASADLYLKKLIDGDIAAIADNPFFDGVKMQAPTSTTGTSIQQMTEFNQYMKASLMNEIGLSANFNMKRERLISSEVDQAEDSLFPYVYDMMQCRMMAIEKANEMFGLSIEIDFGSVWALKNKKLVDEVIGDNTESESLPAVAEGATPVNEAESQTGDGSEALPTPPAPTPAPDQIATGDEPAPAEDAPVIQEEAPAEDAPVIQEETPAEDAPVIQEEAPAEDENVIEEEKTNE